jgi:ABC-type Fe3+ transport system substrate-binding protein
VPPWPATNPPPDTLATPDGRALIPSALGGETWRAPAFFGAAVSTFGICYNTDRLRDLGIAQPPARWEDLTAPAYFGEIGVADPTKSGSIAKAFEMIVHEQCLRAVQRAGFSREQADAFEAQLARKPAPGRAPPDVPAAYPRAIETGWLDGIRLVQRIGANARYFTDSASKVPIDVSMGNAAAGVAIDFYGRFQAEVSRLPDGRCPLVYVTPAGGSSVSADPIGLLRGAPHRDVAIRFIRFVLGEEGQRLWTYRPGEPGGPRWYALRRLPIRRDFYPSDDPTFQAAHRGHLSHAADALADPTVNPYTLAEGFVYRPRWTGGHFNVHRTLIRAMCLDAGDELRAAWRAILDAGGPAAQPAAMAALGRLPDWPEPLTWESAPRVARKLDPIECLRRWTVFFRASYAEARRLAEAGVPHA